MADEEEWRKKVRDYGGHLVTWIDQSTDQGLRAANSDGVCHAITIDWIASDMISRHERGLPASSGGCGRPA